MNADSLNGMPVVSMAEAARLGAITDVLFAATPLRIAALQARGEATEFVIPFDLVRTLGSDAVMVESSEVTQMASGGSGQGDLSGLAQLRRLKVVDEAGTFVGTIQTVEVDAATGHVTRLVAHKGGLLGVGGASTAFSADAIRSVGADVLTIVPEA